MHPFHYRHTRFPARLPAVLEITNGQIPCRCTEISVAGTRIELAQSLVAGSSGTLILTNHTPAIEMTVRVVHTGSTFSGLEFLGDRDQNRAVVAALIASMAPLQQDRITTLVPRPRILQGLPRH